jgi:hypothetical protein
MKIYWKILLVIIVIGLIYYFKQKLPYGLQLKYMDTYYTIHDGAGYSIIGEDYDRNYTVIERVKVKKMIKYSKNDLGLVVMILDSKNEIKFVAIKPKLEQHYPPELQVDYTIYSEAEYKKMNMGDSWYNIRWRER